MRPVPNSLHDEAASRLREQIFAGSLPPGSFLDEAALCERLAISRTPLREALKVLVAEGDARKMILRATQERKPDVLVMARHSYKPDGNFITRRLDALVEEFDHMTCGSVSAFLARRVQCPLLIIPTHAE